MGAARCDICGRPRSAAWGPGQCKATGTDACYHAAIERERARTADAEARLAALTAAARGLLRTLEQDGGFSPEAEATMIRENCLGPGEVGEPWTAMRIVREALEKP